MAKLANRYLTKALVKDNYPATALLSLSMTARVRALESISCNVLIFVTTGSSSVFDTTQALGEAHHDSVTKAKKENERYTQAASMFIEMWERALRKIEAKSKGPF